MQPTKGKINQGIHAFKTKQLRQIRFKLIKTIIEKDQKQTGNNKLRQQVRNYCIEEM